MNISCFIVTKLEVILTYKNESNILVGTCLIVSYHYSKELEFSERSVLE